MTWEKVLNLQGPAGDQFVTIHGEDDNDPSVWPDGWHVLNERDFYSLLVVRGGVVEAAFGASDSNGGGGGVVVRTTSGDYAALSEGGLLLGSDSDAAKSVLLSGNGKVVIRNGSEAPGRALTCDSAGSATWEDLASLPEGTVVGQQLTWDGTQWVPSGDRVRRTGDTVTGQLDFRPSDQSVAPLIVNPPGAPGNAGRFDMTKPVMLALMKAGISDPANPAPEFIEISFIAGGLHIGARQPLTGSANANAENILGQTNHAIGNYSLVNSPNSRASIALGNYVLQNTTDGRHNIGIGNFALRSLVTGERNIAIGHSANLLGTTRSDSVSLGHQSAAATDSVAIGSGATASTANTVQVGKPTQTFASIKFGNQTFLSMERLKSTVAASVDFADFQAKIATLT